MNHIPQPTSCWRLRLWCIWCKIMMRRSHYLRHLEDQLEPPQDQAIIILLQGGRKDAVPSLGPLCRPFPQQQAEQCSTCRRVSPPSSFPWEPLYGQLPSATGCKQIPSQSFAAPARTGSCLPLRLNSLHALNGVPRSSHTSLPDSPQIYSISSHLRKLALSLLLEKLSFRVSNVSVRQSGQPPAVTF